MTAMKPQMVCAQDLCEFSSRAVDDVRGQGSAAGGPAAHDRALLFQRLQVLDDLHGRTEPCSFERRADLPSGPTTW
jgi:hypothetical protein